MKHELAEIYAFNDGMDIEDAHIMAGMVMHPVFENYDVDILDSFPSQFSIHASRAWGRG